uniref:Glycerophosphodiester phosphodiesterase domain containing 4 n=1 Tax=Canis lupus familiaris TaxID=9615 RepID=A0A8P0NSF3_CANLF
RIETHFCRVVFLGTGYWFFWSIVLLSLFGILAAYSSLLVVLAFLLVWEGYELYLHWCHKIVILIVIMICSFFLWILCKFWRDRWLTAGLSLQVFAPYIHLSSITVMVILSWPVAFYLIHLEEEARVRRYKMAHNDRERTKRCNIITKLRALQVAIGLPFFFILLCLYVVPLGIHSPCIQEEGKLGPKPDFFGHRGAPMLGPENTMMAFEKAVEQGAYGLESDVHLSYDLVPFLMHDSDLRRTTNIREVMPNASFTHSSLFTWSFLSTLNAGKWFVQSRFKPFYKMKRLSKADREKAENQTIPRLTDLLELAQKEQKFVIFDLNGPTRKHPLRNTYVRHVVSVILASKIEQHLIFWLSSFDRQYVRNAAPGFQQVGRLFSIERLTKENISIINVDYKRLFYNDFKCSKTVLGQPWWRRGLAPPAARGVILETLDQVPHRAPNMEPTSPSACVSASLSLCVCVSINKNKIFKTTTTTKKKQQQSFPCRDIYIQNQFDPVDQCPQLQHLLPCALVVAPEILGQLLPKAEQVVGMERMGRSGFLPYQPDVRSTAYPAFRPTCFSSLI